MLFERAAQRRPFCLCRRWLGGHDHIKAFDQPPVQPERLAHVAFDPVTVDRPFGHLAGNRNAQPGDRALPDRRGRKPRIAMTQARAQHRRELRRAPQPLRLRQREAGAHPPQALRRARPLARRALNIARPLRVLMRARKPCVRLRFRTLG